MDINDNMTPSRHLSDFEIAAASITAHVVDSMSIYEVVSAMTVERLGRGGPISDNDYDWFDAECRVYEELMECAKQQLRGIKASAADDTALSA